MIAEALPPRPDPITDAEIDNVCELIATGRSFEPVPRCGAVLLECCYLGLFADTRRAVPTLSPTGVARARRGGGLLR